MSDDFQSAASAPFLRAVARLNVCAMAGGADEARRLAQEIEGFGQGREEISDALATAIAYGNDETAAALVPFADLSAQSHCYPRGADALLAAAHGGCHGAVAAILATKACDPAATNHHGDTALIFASGLFDSRAALSLIPHSDPSHVNRQGEDALDHAILADNATTALALLDAMDPQLSRARASRAIERSTQAGFAQLAQAMRAWAQARDIAACATPAAPAKPRSL